jgi:opacity protein-like surface antigen
MQVLRRYRRAAMLTILSALFLVVSAQAQVGPSAYKPGHALWVGADYSNVNASFPYQSGQRISGAGAFVDWRLSYHLDIEGDAHFLNFGGFEGTTESSYLAGPKAFFLAKGKFRPYGQMLAGVGRIHYPFDIGNANYFALAPGAGTEYSVSRRWMLRAEYEYQFWLNSPGYANEPDHQLTPNGIHVGIAYGIFR